MSTPHKLKAWADASLRRDLRSSNNRAKPIARKAVHVAGDIRPGEYVATVPVASRNNNWSIPRFQPKRYSVPVAKARSKTRRALTRPMKRCEPGGGYGSCSNRDAAESTRLRAVLAFIVTRPGRIDFKTSM